jgi:hypothetical protein
MPSDATCLGGFAGGLLSRIDCALLRFQQRLLMLQLLGELLNLELLRGQRVFQSLDIGGGDRRRRCRGRSGSRSWVGKRDVGRGLGLCPGASR